MAGGGAVAFSQTGGRRGRGIHFLPGKSGFHPRGRIPSGDGTGAGEPAAAGAGLSGRRHKLPVRAIERVRNSIGEN